MRVEYKGFGVFEYVRMPLIILMSALYGCQQHRDTDWAEYYGDGSRSHYSALDQVDRENVDQLEVAWTYSSGGADTLLNRTQMQCNPIIIDGILYGVSANTQVFSVDAASGRELWKTDIKDNGGTTSRGVSYWSDGSEQRIFFGAGKWLYAFDAVTGALAVEFGENGRVDLKKGIERPDADDYVTSNTPNTIYRNLIITGVRVSEGKQRYLATLGHMMLAAGSWSGPFIPFPKKGRRGMRVGIRNIPGSGLAVQTAGWAWPSTASGESSMSRRVLLLTISTVGTGRAIICMQTACLHWMRQRGRRSGTTSWYAMIFGTVTLQPRPTCSRSTARGNGSMRSR